MKLVVQLHSVKDCKTTLTDSMVEVIPAAMMVPSTSWSASMELVTLRTWRTCSISSTPTELDHLAASALPCTLSASQTPTSVQRFMKSRLHKMSPPLPSLVDYAVSRSNAFLLCCYNASSAMLISVFLQTMRGRCVLDLTHTLPSGCLEVVCSATPSRVYMVPSSTSSGMSSSR